MLLVDLKGEPDFDVPECAIDATPLPAGDAVVVCNTGQRVGIEHKTLKAFLFAVWNGSASDGKLADQLARLHDEYDDALLIIQGRETFAGDVMKIKAGGKEEVGYKNYIATLLSLHFRGVNVICTPDARHTRMALEAIEHYCATTDFAGFRRAIVVDVGKRVPPDVAMLAQVPGWGVGLAERALKAFGSLTAFLAAAEDNEALVRSRVKAVGPAKLAALRRVLHGESGV